MMGCSFSRSHARETNTRVFRVYNVDDQGLELNPGKIEVGDTDLILYQRGKEPIRWPLRCLRRYGFDAELFSFESGRRCPTGAGIYAFKCRNAESLFNMVQECIQRAGQEDVNRASQNILGPSSRPNSRPQSLNESHDMYRFVVAGGDGGGGGGRNNSVSSANGMHLYINGSMIPEPDHEYINTGIPSSPSPVVVDQTSALFDFLHNPQIQAASPEPAVNYAVLDLPKSTENLAALCEDGSAIGHDGTTDSKLEVNSMSGAVGADDVVLSQEADGAADYDCTSCPMYINIGAEMAFSPKEKALPNGLSIKPTVDHNYANLGLPESSAPQWTNSTPPRARHKEVVKVNYIQLDLKNQCSESLANGVLASPTSAHSLSVFPESPCRKTESYAMIDFDKTVALSNTAKNVDDLRVEPGVRKTRHNSVIPNLH
ncbi:fibroblast growth factor receptor substrate 2-like [Gigantopelta aegis]|uniref:fibroblast growth factor receptor substrate 2-like n=1 Tax=Gigantopelta aegis TaxID=1735272 RepID=UPI001B88AF2B|nr:fibroblast growth factor receptor substrate 2-like [Gigantopelta aegis]